MTTRTAIVGAGIAGLTLARDLRDAGHQVTIFDKARGPGGRMAARRVEASTIDHGAQFFTATDPGFRQAVDQWSVHGVVAVWAPRYARIAADGSISLERDARTRFVGTPRMSAITRDLSRGLDLHCEHRIAAITGGIGDWHLHDDNHDGFGPYDQVLLALPAPQAQELLDPHGFGLEVLGATRVAPCWAGLFSFDQALAVDWDAADCDHGPLAWLARNNSKPARGRKETWIVHANPEWSQANLGREPADVIDDLRTAFADLVGNLPEPTYAKAHRWRFAKVIQAAPKPSLYDCSLGLGACGDWGLVGKVEGAWLSAKHLAEQIAACAIKAA